MKGLIFLAITIIALYIVCNNESDKRCNTTHKVELVVMVNVEIIKDSTFVMYKDSLGFKESGLRYGVVNKYGYMGKYQFGKIALKDLNLHKMSRTEFLAAHALQEKAFESLLSLNKYRLRNYFKHVGRTINGIKVTESGMLSAAHLVGATSVKKWLRTDGRKNRADANGTTVETYMSKFGGYDVSNVIAIKTIKLKQLN